MEKRKKANSVYKSLAEWRKDDFNSYEIADKSDLKMVSEYYNKLNSAIENVEGREKFIQYMYDIYVLIYDDYSSLITKVIKESQKLDLELNECLNNINFMEVILVDAEMNFLNSLISCDKSEFPKSFIKACKKLHKSFNDSYPNVDDSVYKVAFISMNLVITELLKRYKVGKYKTKIYCHASLLSGGSNNKHRIEVKIFQAIKDYYLIRSLESVEYLSFNTEDLIELETIIENKLLVETFEMEKESSNIEDIFTECVILVNEKYSGNQLNDSKSENGK